MTKLQTIRETMRGQTLAADAHVIATLRGSSRIDDAMRAATHVRATSLVKGIRDDSRPGLMEVFLAEYGLSTEEGVALMCLAEALLRVPDDETIDALIEDKIAPSEWGAHLGHSSSSLVNAATWGLMLTGKVLKDGTGIAQTLRGAVRRLGEPVIRTAVGRAMREMGAQFVLGETIEKAVARGKDMQKKGYTYSYDMLGEAALTAHDAQHFYDAYEAAIAKLATECTSTDTRRNPGISIKLSALHPRYEETQRARVMDELVPRTVALAKMARDAGMGLNIDAEEADRLDLSLDVIEAVLSDESLAGWDGFGVVVQAYGKRASLVIDWLHALAERLDRKIMVRLVKGAYWDTEIKRAQVEGLTGFPVFQRKEATDVHYMLCAEKLLGMTDRVYPQFATHNAHTVAAVLELAGDDRDSFEFQRLHGMGAALHDLVIKNAKARCRIYAPVGAHRDLLAYLVRRLLENGANSSFVNQIVDDNVPPETVAADPFTAFDRGGENRAVTHPSDLYGAERRNARGWNLRDVVDLAEIEEARAPYAKSTWTAGPILAGDPVGGGETLEVRNPARHSDLVGHCTLSSAADVEQALATAEVWKAPAGDRAAALTQAAQLMEDRFGEFFSVLCREAGKTQLDAIGELREAVDFLRYYAARGRELDAPARGVLTCISPWNFPLAIFTGQIAACLAAGNGVLAKPAEPTALTAALAVTCLHDAGVPRSALQLLPGDGKTVGAALTGDARVAGVCFTGSTATAQMINRSMAEAMAPTAPLVAETGGLNAMIVDSTALPEQAVRDIVASAFQSAGQRCSALRCLYVQEDVAETVLKMLYGAIDELRLGDPWDVTTDLGPVITAQAQRDITAYIEAARRDGRVLKQLSAPTEGTFVAPTVIKVAGLQDMDREIFGPVLHVATYKARDLQKVLAAINASGFGLTFGIHSRIDDRVAEITEALQVGNIYVNRNQIGAIVGSQPFGGEGMSGTGPKAGGPNYVARFTKPATRRLDPAFGTNADVAAVQSAITTADGAQPGALSSVSLPGPTGESNRFSVHGRGVILCLGPTRDAAAEQARVARGNGCRAVIVVPGATGPLSVDGVLDRAALTDLTGFDAVALWSGSDDLKTARAALAARKGRIIPLLAEDDLAERCLLERHVCIDTTAAGGNASLLAAAGG
ncbi:bifunctional proline dehydrogenase/L-glutamate gamma-semialdehyde dehydrogenase PutA (plasmid) [Rhodobacteraceae bacterium SC52]|nr:bifunctional proline dehydrogenase/L-glutamate gamma-semialdehyde dehydrogenase PutA [Rhodobacteraceae bacterium SC52]